MKEQDTPARPPDMLRRLADENDALRARLARHEFRQLERELTSDAPFRLDVRAAAVDPPTWIGAATVDAPLLPRLPVPASAIEAQDPAIGLPVIAVHDDGLAGRKLALALLGLFKTQYRAPFARFVFLLSSFEALPFLGRYGFVAEHLGPTAPDAALPRLHRRYGVRQVRSLESGRLLAEMNDPNGR